MTSRKSQYDQFIDGFDKVISRMGKEIDAGELAAAAGFLAAGAGHISNEVAIMRQIMIDNYDRAVAKARAKGRTS